MNKVNKYPALWNLVLWGREDHIILGKDKHGKECAILNSVVRAASQRWHCTETWRVGRKLCNFLGKMILSSRNSKHRSPGWNRACGGWASARKQKQAEQEDLQVILCVCSFLGKVESRVLEFLSRLMIWPCLQLWGWFSLLAGWIEKAGCGNREISRDCLYKNLEVRAGPWASPREVKSLLNSEWFGLRIYEDLMTECRQKEEEGVQGDIEFYDWATEEVTIYKMEGSWKKWVRVEAQCLWDLQVEILSRQLGMGIWRWEDGTGEVAWRWNSLKTPETW